MSVALVLYFAVAGLFLVETLHESGSKQLSWDGYRFLGVALAVAWPLAVAIVLVAPPRGARVTVQKLISKLE